MGALRPRTGRGVLETPRKHRGAAGWSIVSGSLLTFAVLEKRLQLPASVSLLGMGAETPLVLS